jgi:hypothetical protein
LPLSVIIAGALLFFGGATSLVFGFDIVMTERGSAMTLGGIIAMSGGVIAVGIGLCLQRLSQLLAVLETKRSRYSALPDRPVVPIVTADHARNDLDTKDLDTKDLETKDLETKNLETKNLDTKDLEKATQIFPRHPALGAGLVTAAGIAGTIAVPERQNEAEDQNIGPDVKTTQEPLVEPPTPTAEPAHIIPMLDLEAELSRALQENHEENQAPAADIAKVDPAQTFSGSLSGLLAKPSSRKRRSAAVEPFEPHTSALAENGDEGRDRTTAPAADDGSAALDPRHGLEFDDVPETDTINVPASTEVDGPSTAVLIPNALDADHEKAPELQVSTDDKESAESSGPGPAESAVADAPEPVPTGNPKQPGIIGSYKVGGRSYTMFADGSVEAMTESGIQRFESMDQLRRHLAGTRA